MEILYTDLWPIWTNELLSPNVLVVWRCRVPGKGHWLWTGAICNQRHKRPPKRPWAPIKQGPWPPPAGARGARVGRREPLSLPGNKPGCVQSGRTGWQRHSLCSGVSAGARGSKVSWGLGPSPPPTPRWGKRGWSVWTAPRVGGVGLHLSLTRSPPSSPKCHSWMTQRMAVIRPGLLTHSYAVKIWLISIWWLQKWLPYPDCLRSYILSIYILAKEK